MTGGTNRFAGKVAVVAGSGSGIGCATCLTLAEGCADVVVVSNVAEQAGAVAAEVCTLGVKGIARTVDVTDLAAVEVLSAEVDKNLGGAFYCIKAFLPGALARDWGRIITLSSVSGKLPTALNSGYAASKHGVIELTKTIAIELGMLGKNRVTTNALCPGSIDTPMMEAITDQLAPGMNMDREKFRKVAVAKNIRRRLLDP